MIYHSHLSLTEIIGMLAGKIIENDNTKSLKKFDY